MKNVILSILIIFSLTIISCNDDTNTDTDTDGVISPEKDIISFKLNDENIRLITGLTDKGNVPFIELCNDNYIFIFGGAGNTDVNSTGGGTYDIYLNFEINKETIGAGLYDESTISFNYVTGSDNYNIQGSFTATINEINGVGEYSTGTFSGTVTDGSGDIPVTDGQFNVKRIEDCCWL